MKKRFVILAILSIVLLIGVLFTYRYNEATEKITFEENEIKEVAWASLTDGDKKYAGDDWKDAKIEIVKWERIPSLNVSGSKNIFKILWFYYKKDDTAVRVCFDKRYDPTLGPIAKYVDPETMKVIGFDYLF